LAICPHFDGAGHQPFSTFDDGDTLFAVWTREIPGGNPDLIDLDTIAGETMWDAILASVPAEPKFTPPQCRSRSSPQSSPATPGDTGSARIR
jgi:hypothetical protein